MSPPLELAWVGASIPKAGHTPAENEDAIAADVERMRFVVADGATEGWQSGAWAGHLAASYRDHSPSPLDFTDWLAAVRSRWTPPGSTRPATWYSQAKEEQGSFSTFLGLEFRKSTGRSGLAWKAVAVGDSCLFVVRGDRFEVSFPITAVEEFGNRPALVPSSPERKCPPPAWLAGWVEPGDLFVLATDAAARVLLGESRSTRENSLFPAVRQAVDTVASGPLEAALTALSGSLNDDATIVAIAAREAAGKQTQGTSKR